MNVKQMATKFKSELKVMEANAKPGDQMPQEVFFTTMNVFAASLDTLVEKLEECESKLQQEEEDGRNG